MKKTLSLLLVLTMVLATFSFGFAAKADEEVAPGEILKDLGVLEGNASGDLMLEKELSRQDMVVLLSRVLGEEETAEDFEGEMTFEDVNDPFYKPYIAWAEANKLTEGVGEGQFGFGRAVTEKEIACYMLRALGYDIDWEKVEEKAVEIKLVDAKADLSKDATREVMAEITYQALQTKMNDSDQTLAEKLDLELPEPAELEVEEVKADNLKEIQVKFNKSVERDIVEDVDLYSTTAGAIKDARLAEDEETVILTLSGEMINKKDNYKLTIKGLKDNDERYDFEEEFKVLDNAVPEVVEVKGLGTKAVKVVMSEPVEKPKAKNFRIDGDSYYGSVEAEGREIILKPYSSKLSVGDHKLTVLSLEDFAGFKSVEKVVEFEVVEDKDAPTVENVKGSLERIVVEFSEDVDADTVDKDSLYWETKSHKADRVIRLSGNRYAFEFDKHSLPTYEVTLHIQGVKDYSGNAMKSEEVPYKGVIDETRPEVISVKMDDAKTIVVKFNKSLHEEEAQDKKNYKVIDEDGKNISIRSAKLDKKDTKREVTIELYNDLKNNKEYTLKIDELKDNTKLRNTILPYETTITPGNYTNPEIDGIAANNSDRTIHVLFNKKMDVSTIADADNYMIVYNTKEDTNVKRLLSALDADIDVVEDGRGVVITLPEKIDKLKVGSTLKIGNNIGEDQKEHNENRIHRLIVLGVKDEGDNILKDYGISKTIGTEAVKVTNAVAKNRTTIELTFNQPILDADEDDFSENGSFVIDDVITDGSDVVTIKVDEDHKIPADVNSVTLSICSGNTIETILGNDIVNPEDSTKDIEIKNIKDEIKPSLKDVKKEDKENGSLEIKLIFDEKLYPHNVEDFKNDLVIYRLNGNKKLSPAEDYTTKFGTKKVEDKDEPVTDEKVVIVTIDDSEILKEDSVYSVEVKEGASFIKDASKNHNVVNETKEPFETKEVKLSKVVKDNEEAYDSIKKSIETAVSDYETAVKNFIAEDEEVEEATVRDAKTKAEKDLDKLNNDDKSAFTERINKANSDFAEFKTGVETNRLDKEAIDLALTKIDDMELPVVNKDTIKEKVEELIDNKDIVVKVEKLSKEGQYKVTLTKGNIEEPAFINVTKKDEAPTTYKVTFKVTLGGKTIADADIKVKDSKGNSVNDLENVVAGSYTYTVTGTDKYEAITDGNFEVKDADKVVTITLTSTSANQ